MQSFSEISDVSILQSFRVADPAIKHAAPLDPAIKAMSLAPAKPAETVRSHYSCQYKPHFNTYVIQPSAKAPTATAKGSVWAPTKAEASDSAIKHAVPVAAAPQASALPKPQSKVSNLK